ncbi:hypothetical protein RJT34_25875 [Clitoria ternatea]|uniref:Uncharacterized protein n=1 Tax=Clitoria ternatea TaxID=43366 RepID=A0AAN9IH85_CLITE
MVEVSPLSRPLRRFFLYHHHTHFNLFRFCLSLSFDCYHKLINILHPSLHIKKSMRCQLVKKKCEKDLGLI